ncbi:hypothetical protein L21_1151 [Methanoculleus chikugoensis]|jgi:hypothetical protein|uniref:Uncharacterized protein n=1 Tax=Methanoculleus chikugoensis TaxID=118126 RepID=A0A1M4MK86_9EURY|nr:hypothetical protein L21_1151 [Methanoculleus chikugoensis]
MDGRTGINPIHFLDFPGATGSGAEVWGTLSRRSHTPDAHLRGRVTGEPEIGMPGSERASVIEGIIGKIRIKCEITGTTAAHPQNHRKVAEK